jgi:hypothetical protein
MGKEILMEIIDAGHKYHLSNLQGSFPMQELRFIKKENGITVYDGTTNEEVLEALIDRMNAIDKVLPCQDNQRVISALNIALGHTRERARKRMSQGVLGTDKPHQEGA